MISSGFAQDGPRCDECDVALVLRPTSTQTLEMLATGPWWDHPNRHGGDGYWIGHTHSVTTGKFGE